MHPGLHLDGVVYDMHDGPNSIPHSANNTPIETELNPIGDY